MSGSLALSNDGFSKTLQDCKGYSENIISDIFALLTDNGVQAVQLSPSELKIEHGDKEQIKSLITKNNLLPSQVVSLLIDIRHCKSGVFIRQKRR